MQRFEFCLDEWYDSSMKGTVEKKKKDNENLKIDHKIHRFG